MLIWEGLHRSELHHWKHQSGPPLVKASKGGVDIPDGGYNNLARDYQEFVGEG